MSNTSESGTIAASSKTMRVLVLAPTRADRWAGRGAHRGANVEFEIIHDRDECLAALPRDNHDAVIITANWLADTSARTVDIVDGIRGVADIPIVVEGEFELGQRLPGNANACIPTGASREHIEVALDSALRQARLQRATSSERVFVESLLDSAQILVLSIDAEFRIREFNRGCEVSTGRSLGDVYGRHFTDIVEGFDEADFAELIQSTRSTSRRRSSVLEFETVDGKSRLVECTFAPFTDQSGDVECTIVTGIDITEQRRVESALRESEQAFRSVVESSPDSVVVVSVDEGDWLYANPAAFDLVGVDSFEALREIRLFDLLRPDERSALLERVQKVLETGKPQPAEVQLWLPNGDSAWIETLELPLKYRGHSAILAISRDLTDRKELMARMMQLDRMVAVGTLAAGVGHEINNPLAYLTSNIEYATDQLRGTEPDENAIEDVVLALEEAADGAVRVRDIVRDLKDLSRHDSDQLEPIDIESVLESSLNVAWHEIRTRANVRRNFRPVPLVHGSAGRVRQLFVNILVNAAQAMEGCDPTDSFITLEIAPADDGERVSVSVTDQGTGISEEEQRRVFDPFYTTRPVGSGTGLGLTIAQRIVDAVRGSISIRSEVGTGTTVEILFETVASEPCEATDLDPSHQVPIRLLLLDDEPMIARSVRRALADGSEVIAFQNGSEALEHLKGDRDFDAILCDLVMPHISGPEFYLTLSDRWPELERRVVFMTGGAYTDPTAEFADANDARILEKPFAALDLREVLYEAARH